MLTCVDVLGSTDETTQINYVCAEQRGASSFPAVENCETSAFGNIQVTTRDLKKFKEELNHLLCSSKDDLFVCSEMFNMSGGDLYQTLSNAFVYDLS
jgi:hypothetical protein